MQFRRSLPPQSPEPLRAAYHHRLLLDSRAQSAVLDGQEHRAELGCWMFYLPDLQAKLFHAAQAHIECTHATRPQEAALNQPGRIVGRYRTEDWRRALTTPITRRLAEVWLVSVRLWKAGLGPQPLGVCFVERFARDGRQLGPTCGLLTQDVFALPRKLDCRVEHVRRAGVVPDRILSCVRQQIRGYVVDLCSVVGCVPEDAESAVQQLDAVFRDRPTEIQLKEALEETFRSV